jgi:aspartyl/asparaginyl-tRNA synthetase
MYVVSFAYLEKLFRPVDLEKYLAQFEHGYQPSGTLAHGFERVVCYGLEKFSYQVGLI